MPRAPQHFRSTWTHTAASVCFARLSISALSFNSALARPEQSIHGGSLQINVEHGYRSVESWHESVTQNRPVPTFSFGSFGSCLHRHVGVGAAGRGVEIRVWEEGAGVLHLTRHWHRRRDTCTTLCLIVRLTGTPDAGKSSCLTIKLTGKPDVGKASCLTIRYTRCWYNLMSDHQVHQILVQPCV